MKKILFLRTFLLFTITVLFTNICTAQISTGDKSIEQIYHLALSEQTVLEEFFEKQDLNDEYLELKESFEILYASFINGAVSQRYHMYENTLSFCDIRDDKFTIPESYFVSSYEHNLLDNTSASFIRYLTGNLSIAPNMVKLCTILPQYIDEAILLKYTKVEMFHDFTGYWAPDVYTYYYLDPFDSIRAVHGLLSNDAYQKLLDYNSSTTKDVYCLPPKNKEKPKENSQIFNKSLLTILTFPNPSRESITIKFEIVKEGKTSINILSAETGNLVKQLVHNNFTPIGTHEVYWDLKSNGEKVPSGIYIIQLLSNETVNETKTMIF